MEKIVSTTIQGMVTDENEQAFFVQKNGVTYQLSKQELQGEITLGDIISGFVYENHTKKLMMTMNIPSITQESYGWATVTEVRKDLGVFVDIGLPDKDMVVSLDELPSMTALWPKKGNRLYVRLTLDKKGRTWATLAEDSEFKKMAKRGVEAQLNHNKTAIVTRLKLVGTTLYTQDGYLCFLHPSERFYEPKLGEELEVRIIGLRQDGVYNVSTRPRAHEAISDDAQMILMMLENRPQHELPYGDKTSPEIIQEVFGISKGQFKRAIGSLLKSKKIIQENNSIRLVNTQD